METITLSTGSGGSPNILAGLEFLKGTTQARYDTVANGRAYSWNVEFHGEETGLTAHFDGRNWKQYRQESGPTFWWSHRQGSPRDFDSGRLLLEIEDKFRTDEIGLEDLPDAPEKAQRVGLNNWDGVPGGMYSDYKRAHVFDADGTDVWPFANRVARWAIQTEFVQARPYDYWDEELEQQVTEMGDDSFTVTPCMRVKGGWVEVSLDACPDWLKAKVEEMVGEDAI